MAIIIGEVGKTGRHCVDIGGGIEVHRHGNDENGNHCVWVTYSGQHRARKIQTNGNLPVQHRNRGVITEESAEEIRDYVKRYMVPKKR